MNIQKTTERAKEEFSPGDGEEEDYEDYEVYATFSEEAGEECVGTITLRKITKIDDYPVELEIDGVVYYPKF